MSLRVRPASSTLTGAREMRVVCEVVWQHPARRGTASVAANVGGLDDLGEIKVADNLIADSLCWVASLTSEHHSTFVPVRLRRHWLCYVWSWRPGCLIEPLYQFVPWERPIWLGLYQDRDHLCVDLLCTLVPRGRPHRLPLTSHCHHRV